MAVTQVKFNRIRSALACAAVSMLFAACGGGGEVTQGQNGSGSSANAGGTGGQTGQGGNGGTQVKLGVKPAFLARTCHPANPGPQEFCPTAH